jgi:hypothetical protein
MTRWVWWAGHKDSVEEEGNYNIGEAATRAEAIALGYAETSPYDQFYVIEAIMGAPDEEALEDDPIPFAKMRNRELLTHVEGVAS